MGDQRIFDLIVTLNPQWINDENLARFVELGVTIFRLNGSFLLESGTEGMVSKIRRQCGDQARILLDLPGFKPRFSAIDGEIPYAANVPMTVRIQQINYPEIITHMGVGDSIRINDGMVRLRLVSVNDGAVVFLPDRSGILRRGKGFYLEKLGYRPASHCLSHLDVSLIEAAKKFGIDYVGLSFVHDSGDIEHVKSYLKGSQTGFIPKIEARESLEWGNLVSILSGSETVIIDRGDLSGELGLENIWLNQRKVIELANVLRCRVIVATQFFTKMLDSPLPSIAEVDSFHDLLRFGIDGVQLSEETCVGGNGFDVVKLIQDGVKKVGRGFQGNGSSKGSVVWILGPTSSGKTTIAKTLEERLSRSRIPVSLIDGDEIRNLFGPGLHFGPEDRLRVVSTIIHHAEKYASSGQNVIVSALTAHEDARRLIRERLEKLTVVSLDCPIQECAKRDAKGLYAKAFRGEIDTLIGVNTPYMPPKDPDIVLDTSMQSVEECVNALLIFLLRERRLRCWGEECSEVVKAGGRQ